MHGCNCVCEVMEGEGGVEISLQVHPSKQKKNLFILLTHYFYPLWDKTHPKKFGLMY